MGCRGPWSALSAPSTACTSSALRAARPAGCPRLLGRPRRPRPPRRPALSLLRLRRSGPASRLQSGPFCKEQRASGYAAAAVAAASAAEATATATTTTTAAAAQAGRAVGTAAAPATAETLHGQAHRAAAPGLGSGGSRAGRPGRAGERGSGHAGRGGDPGREEGCGGGLGGGARGRGAAKITGDAIQAIPGHPLRRGKNFFQLKKISKKYIYNVKRSVFFKATLQCTPPLKREV